MSNATPSLVQFIIDHAEAIGSVLTVIAAKYGIDGIKSLRTKKESTQLKVDSLEMALDQLDKMSLKLSELLEEKVAEAQQNVELRLENVELKGLIERIEDVCDCAKKLIKEYELSKDEQN